MNKKEIRLNTINSLENESRKVEGYGVVFNSPSVDIGFIEVIHRGAITEDTIKRSDVLAKFNHNDNQVLARCKNGKGSLYLEVDDKGLKYSFEAPNTQTGNELLEHLQRGDITQSSFAFDVDRNNPESEKWSKRDGKIYRDIFHINKLYDVSPVWTPAYEATNVSISQRYQDVLSKSEEVDKVIDTLQQEINAL